MKLRDQFRLAWHNVANNKLRSLFTVVIVTIIGALTMAALCLAIPFSQNARDVYRLQNLTQTPEISCNLNRQFLIEERFKSLQRFTDAHRDRIVSVCGIDYSTAFYDFGCSSFPDLRFLDGNAPSPALIGTPEDGLPAIFLKNSAFYRSLFAVGDEYQTPSFFDGQRFTVRGFFESATETETYLDCILDLTFAYERFTPFSYLNVTLHEANEANYSRTVREYESLLREFQKTFPDAISFYLENASAARYLSFFVLGGSVAAILMLLLLTVGCISNSVLISVDQNRRFIGLLKALGADRGTVFKITLFECILLVAAGILLATVVLLALYPVFGSATNALVGVLTDRIGLKTAFVATYVFPFYIPLIFLVVMPCLTLLFASSGLRKTAKENPVDALNEVD